MNYRDIALIEFYEHVRNFCPDPGKLGALYKDSAKEFTGLELKSLLKAYKKLVQTVEKRLDSARIEYTPI